MAVGEVEVLLPVVLSDVVLARAEVIADELADGMVGRRLICHTESGFLEQRINRFCILARKKLTAWIGPRVFRRAGESWEVELYLGPDAVLDMPEIGIAVPLSEIYTGIALASDPA